MSLKHKLTGKKSALSKELNKAIAQGSNWRPHLTAMQTLSLVPEVLEREIMMLENTIRSFYKDGGDISYVETADGAYKVTMVYEGVTWTVIYDANGRKRRKIIDDQTAGELSPDIIQTIVSTAIAHIDLPKKRYALKQLAILAAYLEDDNAKDAVEHLVKSFDGNDIVAFNAAMQTSATDVDLDSFLEEING